MDKSAERAALLSLKSAEAFFANFTDHFAAIERCLEKRLQTLALVLSYSGIDAVGVLISGSKAPAEYAE